MKKSILFLLGLLLYVTGFSQTLRDSLFWTTPYYDIVYSEVLEQPRSAYYRVVCPTSTTSRAGMDFYTEKGIKTSDNKDYENNVWDKGHLVPVGSLRCNKNMVYATFSYMNCALQHEKLNRGVWKALEAREQNLVTTNVEVYVSIQVDFAPNPQRLPTNAAIPSGFYKEIKYGNVKECYYFPNTIPTSSDYNTFKCNCR